MNSISSNVIKTAIRSKRYDIITELAKIEYPDKNDIVVTEYNGSGVRLYKDNKNRIRILCPTDIDVYQENHVTDSITNGTIFDDADEVDNNAEMIEKTTIPYNAMINTGKDSPKKLKPMIAIIIGKMDDDGSFTVSDIDRDNGNRFVKSIVCCKEKGADIPSIVGDYIDKDKDKFYTPEMGRDIADLEKEVGDIKDTKNEDVITDDDTVDDYDFLDINDDDNDDECDDDNESKDNDEEDTDEDDDENNDEKDEDETEEYSDNEENDDEEIDEYVNRFFDDNIYQEGVIKTLKRIGYDPKTKTILTDIPDMNGKNGEKIKCSLKINDMASIINGPCIEKNGENSVIHIPLKDLLGNTDKIISVLKHEEGHLYVSLDKERFKKDFEKAQRLVDKYGDKLSDHGNVPEEYVADLYSARKSGDNGSALIEYLKDSARKTAKTAERHREIITATITGLKKIGTKVYYNQHLSENESEKIDKEFGKVGKMFEKILPGIVEIMDLIMISYKNKVDPKSREYTNQHKDQSQFMKKPKKILDTVIKTIKQIISSIKHYDRITLKNVPKKDYDKLIKDTIIARDNLDGFVKAYFNEMKARIAFIKRYVKESSYIKPNYNEDIYQEGLFTKKPKKLKPIPRDIIAYITVEMNDISSANDQAMLSGYTCSKLELVDFYLTVLDTQDPRYIVPHTRQYLENMKNELERLLTQILRIRPINRSDRIWRMNVTYPEGWR